MAVKRRLPQGTQSTTGSAGEGNPVTAFEDNADLWNTENEVKLLLSQYTNMLDNKNENNRFRACFYNKMDMN